ncbi:385_t:CDS:1, partial [Racocetra fulgida]
MATNPGNYSLVNELYANSIFDEEEIPNTIEVPDDEIDLVDDILDNDIA